MKLANTTPTTITFSRWIVARRVRTIDRSKDIHIYVQKGTKEKKKKEEKKEGKLKRHAEYKGSTGGQRDDIERRRDYS